MKSFLRVKSTATSALCITALFALFDSACTRVDYIGESYPPTTHVDVFFDVEDIVKEYKVMGHMIATADDDWVSAGKMQKKIVKKAMEKGADAVIFGELKRKQTGEKTTYQESTKDKDGKTKIKGSSKTKAEFEKEVKVTLIKYK